MRELGFKNLLKDEYQGSFITSFYDPEEADYDFTKFYNLFKRKGFVVYLEKVSKISAFRIGNSSDVYPEDMRWLLKAIEEYMYWEK